MEEILKLLNDIHNCIAPITAFVIISSMLFIGNQVYKFLCNYSLVKREDKLEDKGEGN